MIKREGNGTTAISRLVSIDTVRGIDMFLLLIAGRIVLACSNTWPDSWFWTAVRSQFEHPDWEGFTLYDLIFPLFEFLIGASVVLATKQHLARSDDKSKMLLRAFKRVAIMVLLGFCVNGNLLTWDSNKMRLTYSVLQMLAISYLISFLTVLYVPFRWQMVLFFNLLLGYWFLQTFVPLPAASYSYTNWMGVDVNAEPHRIGVYREGSLVSFWLDRQVFGDWDRWQVGWILESMTHGCSSLLGVFAMRCLMNNDMTWQSRANAVAGLGLLCLLAGGIWHFQFPIIKNLWSSSFVLWAGGWSCLLLALIYAVNDGLGWQRWSYPFQVVGANSILAYLMSTVGSPIIHSSANILIGNAKGLLGSGFPILYAVVWSVIAWTILWVLYRHKVFFRI